jgi:hypothetical protein
LTLSSAPTTISRDQRERVEWQAPLSWLQLAALALCAVAFALRIWHLAFQSLWWDEGVSIYLAGQGVRALTVDKDFTVDIHPPLYHLVLAGWTALAGPSVFSCRLLSVFGGVVTIPLTVRGAGSLLGGLPRRGLGKSASAFVVAPLVAGILATGSPIDVFYSQESRMYPFLPALGAASLLATLGLLREPSWRHWLTWIAINLVAVYTFYYLGLLAVAEALALLLLDDGAFGDGALGRRRRWAVGQLALVLGFAPWAFLVARRLGANGLVLPVQTEVHLTVWQFVIETWTAFTIGFTFPPSGVALTLVWAVFALAGIALLARRSPVTAFVTLAVLLLPIVVAGTILLIRPFYYPRFVLFDLAPLWIVVGIGVTGLPSWVATRIRQSRAEGRNGARVRASRQVANLRAKLPRRAWIASGVVLAVVLAGNAWTWYHERTTPRVGYAPDDYRVVFTSLSERIQPGDLVVGDYPWQAGYARAYFWRLAPRVQYVKPNIAPVALAGLAGAAPRIWVLTYSPDRTFAPDAVETMLARLGTTTYVDQNGDSRVRLVQSAPSRFPPEDVVATFDRAIGLERTIGPTPRRARSGAMISETLRWRALTPPSGDYTVFVHLIGPDGKLWGQVDSPPLGGSFPTGGWTAGEELVDRYNLPVAAEAPSGQYQVQVGLYRPTTGQRLVVGPVPIADNSVVVGSIEVIAR